MFILLTRLYFLLELVDFTGLNILGLEVGVTPDALTVDENSRNRSCSSGLSEMILSSIHVSGVPQVQILVMELDTCTVESRSRGVTVWTVRLREDGNLITANDLVNLIND